MRNPPNHSPIPAWCFVLAVLIILGISGCGGGGGGGTASPVAASDAYVFPSASTTLNVGAPGVLTNDTGGPITATLVSGPSFATSFMLNPNGSFSYTPNGSGTPDSFTYRAVNGSTSSNVTTVSLTLNQPPVTTNACLSTPVNTSLNGTLTATDEPGSQPVLFQIINDATVGPNKGNVAVNSNGTFTYAPSTNVLGMDKFKFRATDQLGLTSDAIATVFIDGAVRIMPLGDSITQGVFRSETTPGECGSGSGGNCPAADVRIGYRKKLLDDLEALSPSYAVDMVGGLANGSAAGLSLPDDRHEGHPGWCDDNNPFCTVSGGQNIAASVIGFLNSNPADIILLHIGTNHFNIDNSGVNTILNNINTWAQSNYPVTVFVARIIPSVNGTLDVSTFNTNVAAIATDRTAVKVYNVDQQSVLWASSGQPNNANPSLMADNLHPNQTGYNMMADKWKMDMLSAEVLPTCP